MTNQGVSQGGSDSQGSDQLEKKRNPKDKVIIKIKIPYNPVVLNLFLNE